MVVVVVNDLDMFLWKFLNLKNRHREIIIPSLGLDFGEDVMTGAIVAFCNHEEISCYIEGNRTRSKEPGS